MMEKKVSVEAHLLYILLVEKLINGEACLASAVEKTSNLKGRQDRLLRVGIRNPPRYLGAVLFVHARPSFTRTEYRRHVSD